MRIKVDSLNAKLQGSVYRGIMEAEVNEEGRLLFKMADGEVIDIGSVVGPQGDPGEPGPIGPHGYSGVYVGSGEMPEGYEIQIDPNGTDISTPGNMSTLVYDPDNGQRQMAFKDQLFSKLFTDLILPSGGIPKASLAQAIIDSLNKADNSIQIGTETEPKFKESAAASIKKSDIDNWNNKSEFSGDFNDLTNRPQKIKIAYGSYTGGSEDSRHIELGFEPLFAIFKTDDNVQMYSNLLGYTLSYFRATSVFVKGTKGIMYYSDDGGLAIDAANTMDHRTSGNVRMRLLPAEVMADTGLEVGGSLSQYYPWLNRLDVEYHYFAIGLGE